jgi:hypothetical protein
MFSSYELKKKYFKYFNNSIGKTSISGTNKDWGPGGGGIDNNDDNINDNNKRMN